MDNSVGVDPDRCMGSDVLLTRLRMGDRFAFDDEVLTVVEPPQIVWGLVEVWVAEWDTPFQGTE